jgi:hypothetical protein
LFSKKSFDVNHDANEGSGTAKGLKCTKPLSPKLRVEERLRNAVRSHDQLLSSEELLLEKIEREKQEEKTKISKAKKLYAKLKNNGFHTSGVAKPTTIRKVTVPKAPMSILEKRKGKKPIPTSCKILSQSPKKKKIDKKPGELTIPEPFHFATDERLQSHPNVQESATQGLTAAEIAQKFVQDTRSHYVPINAATKVTVPISPKFQTDKRAKIVSKERPLSQHEQDEALMKEFAKHPFKALPLDKKIFESCGELGVPKVAVKEPTVPIDVKLRIDERASSPNRIRSTNESSFNVSDSFVFKARPMPDYTTNPTKNVEQKNQFKPTVPIAPKFHAIHLKEDLSMLNESTNISCIDTSGLTIAMFNKIKPHHKIQEQLKKQQEDQLKKPLKLTVTEPKEFSLQTNIRGEYYKQQFQQLIAEEVEQEKMMHEVKALPKPNLEENVFVPKLSNKPLTEPQPFDLLSNYKHEEYTQQFELQKKILEEEQTKCSFKAKPLPKTTYEPSIPSVVVNNVDVNDENSPTAHNCTKPVTVALESDKRALKRQEFNKQIQLKIQQQEEEQQHEEQERDRKEKLRLQELRRKSIYDGGLQFKARPIQTNDLYPNKHVKPAPVTVPKAPEFHYQGRRNSSSNIMENSTEFPVRSSTKVISSQDDSNLTFSKVAAGKHQRSVTPSSVRTATRTPLTIR